jgi:hypothetical protein
VIDMGWLVFLPAWVALWVVNKRVNPKGGGGGGGKGAPAAGGGGFKVRDIVAVITMLLAFVAGCGLAFTFVGSGLAWVVTKGSAAAASSVHQPGIAWGVPIALTIAAIGIAAADIAFDRKADKGAQYAAMLMPTFLALIVAGSIGVTGGNAVHSVYDQARAYITSMGAS